MANKGIIFSNPYERNQKSVSLSLLFVVFVEWYIPNAPFPFPIYWLHKTKSVALYLRTAFAAYPARASLAVFHGLSAGEAHGLMVLLHKNRKNENVRPLSRSHR